MGRSIPDDNLSLIHPFLCMSFVAAGFAASMAIITALCIRKKTPPPPLSDDSEMTKELNAASPPATTETTGTETENNDMLQTKELPLPPAMQQPKDSNIPNIMKKSVSERKMSFSLSLKMPKSMSMTRRGDHKDENHARIKGKLKAEDSVWMKTIILGEKCVPDEENDAVIYEGKGKRITAYHPKNSASMCFSRQCSFSDPADFTSPQNQEEKIK